MSLTHPQKNAVRVKCPECKTIKWIWPNISHRCECGYDLTINDKYSFEIKGPKEHHL